MYTQCGQCQTIHRVSAKTLGQAYGRVRCMHCGAVFNALDALADELRDDGRFPLQFHSEQPVPLHGDGDGGGLAPVAEPLGRRRVEARSTRLSWLWGGGIVALAMALVSQVAYSERRTLALDPRLRPLYQTWCGWLDCTVELPQAINQIALVNRDIRPHPEIEGALLITATIHNRAPFVQAHPQIGITLADLDNQVIAERFFRPQEYLSATHLIAEGLASNTMLPVAFEVVDPSRSAVAFEFSFR